MYLMLMTQDKIYCIEDKAFSPIKCPHTILSTETKRKEDKLVISIAGIYSINFFIIKSLFLVNLSLITLSLLLRYFLLK